MKILSSLPLIQIEKVLMKKRKSNEAEFQIIVIKYQVNVK